MNPGRAQVLTCPHCGGKKDVISILSGNTIGRVTWSDLKEVTPMLPTPSFIQKCPHCGKYFIATRQETREYASTISFDTGDLPYAELKKAWAQLSCQEDLTEDEKMGILLLLVWGFNDEYTRQEPLSVLNEGQEVKIDEVKKDIPAEECEYFVSIVKQLLNMEDLNNFFRAELFREIGEFDEALKHLESFEIDSDFWRDVKEKTREKIETHDTLPFIILGGI